ncbi:hypothetical protein NJ7G_3945 [Natrinema sp. J7-2]|nr:hypothetical protein NJ7G_3945 [Natrinema sp. J7-2]
MVRGSEAHRLSVPTGPRASVGVSFRGRRSNDRPRAVIRSLGVPIAQQSCDRASGDGQ